MASSFGRRLLADEKYEFERRLKLSGLYMQADLKRAFKRAAKTSHPDIAKFHGVPESLAEENMKRVNEAYAALTSLFEKPPYPESIESDYSPEDDQIEDGFYVFDDEVFLGAFIQFGRYPSSSDHSFRPLTWYVIELGDDFATLITDQCVDCRPFHSRRGPINWASSDIRTWLNTVFFDRAFSADEAAVIMTTQVKNGYVNKYGVPCGPDTNDKVYLLSVEEAEALFANWRDLASVATDFASERGAVVDSDDQAYWWLRSPGRVSDAVSYVEPSGYVHYYDGRSAISEGYSVKPVVRIRLRKRSRDRVERDTERARRRAESEKEAERQASKKRAAQEAEAMARRAQIEKEQVEEADARRAGYTPFDGTPEIGTRIYFGKYPDGEYLSWRVIDVQRGTALLTCEELIAEKPFAFDQRYSIWEESPIRSWLNGDFLHDYFSPFERAAIAEHPVGQSKNAGADRVFLLSADEAERFFPDKPGRVVDASDFALRRGELKAGHCGWWLRTPGTYGNSFVAVVLENGKVLRMGLSCSACGVGVRPSIWVRY